METAWWHALDKKRGSRPRCVLLVDGTSHAVAARLTDLVGLSDVVVSLNECWMPRGKPIWTGKGWDKKPAMEARLDREAGFVAPEIRQQLLEWWLEVVPGADTPHWDVASTCKIEGRDGLLLVEAKSHSNELKKEGKRKPSTENGWKNHERIGSAIEQANTGLGRVAGGSWGLSRDDRYQFANRFAWSWKLAVLGGTGRSAVSRSPELRGHGTGRCAVPDGGRLGTNDEGPYSGCRGQLLLGEATGGERHAFQTVDPCNRSAVHPAPLAKRTQWAKRARGSP